MFPVARQSFVLAHWAPFALYISIFRDKELRSSIEVQNTIKFLFFVKLIDLAHWQQFYGCLHLVLLDCNPNVAGIQSGAWQIFNVLGLYLVV